MRHRRAVEKLRILAETCERVKLFWFDTEPFLKAVYAFGEVLDGADPLDDVQVAVAINLPPEEVPWESTPERADWLADELRLSKGGFLYFWRSYLDPAWNHYIRGPVRVWSVDGGPDEQALAALEARDFGSLNRLVPDPVAAAAASSVRTGRSPRPVPLDIPQPGRHSGHVLRSPAAACHPAWRNPDPGTATQDLMSPEGISPASSRP
jgi:hypothetical protein